MPWSASQAVLAAGVVLCPLALALGCERGTAPASPADVSLPPVASTRLRAPSDFDSIADPSQRSAYLFLEASRVLLHPRCVNCHPAGDSPLQHDTGRIHEPLVVRGEDGQGVVGMECTGCHQDRNLELARVPGAPKWHLAPRSMAWVGKEPRQICEQLKDESRNGGKSLAEIVEHSTHDELVAWGWQPGHGRTPAPGSQPAFGALMRAWADTGAVCPPRGAKP